MIIIEKLLTLTNDIDGINQYLNFIKEHSIIKKIKFESQIHHILPKYYFPQYSNLSKNTWNKSILLHKDHLYAHFLLSKLIGGKMKYAFYTMANIKNNKKNYIDNIDVYLSEYQIAKEAHSINFSINNPSKTKSNIDRMKNDNPVFKKEVRDKISKTLKDKKITFKISDEVKLKMSITKLGCKNPNYGKIGSFNHINNNKIKCKFCQIITTSGNIKRWHDDNCKFKP